MGWGMGVFKTRYRIVKDADNGLFKIQERWFFQWLTWKFSYGSIRWHNTELEAIEAIKDTETFKHRNPNENIVRSIVFKGGKCIAQGKSNG